MSKKLTDSVIVITGASSGIGKAAALEFARNGARLVLAARRANALEETAEECRGVGARALAIPTDVTEEEQVRELARRAVEAHGRIDVWVNNASVGAAGPFEEIPAHAFRRVMETNFFGYVHGARAALPIFKRQGKGTLINNASMVARIPEPYFSAYVASKHAVLGLGGSLRQELFLEGMKDVHVCTVMPSAIDTPFFQHSANYTGRAMKVPPPVYPASMVAEAMVSCAEKPRREFFVGKSGRMFNFQKRLSAKLAEPAMAKMVDATHFYRDRPAPAADGSLFSAMDAGTSVSGGWTSPGGYHELDQEPRKAKASLGRRLAFAAALMALAAGMTAFFRMERTMAV
jgi:short-subunit dehydrogenase